jgi:hypothetical protein
MLILFPLLPAGLDHAGDQSLQGHVAEANTANAEAAQVSPRAPAQVAAVILADFELGLHQVLPGLIN